MFDRFQRSGISDVSKSPTFPIFQLLNFAALQLLKFPTGPGRLAHCSVPGERGTVAALGPGPWSPFLDERLRWTVEAMRYGLILSVTPSLTIARAMSRPGTMSYLCHLLALFRDSRVLPGGGFSSRRIFPRLSLSPRPLGNRRSLSKIVTPADILRNYAVLRGRSDGRLDDEPAGGDVAEPARHHDAATVASTQLLALPPKTERRGPACDLPRLYDAAGGEDPRLLVHVVYRVERRGEGRGFGDPGPHVRHEQHGGVADVRLLITPSGSEPRRCVATPSLDFFVFFFSRKSRTERFKLCFL